jgi:SAM-dependent methyltransferase
MAVIERLRSEQAFHDRQATERAAFFRKHPGRLLVSDNQYLDHESWIRPALASFGNVAGRRVLDFGCGHGMAAVVLAKRGARVTAFDLSSGYLVEARARAAANRVRIDFIQANGESLPFADETFDCVWGNAILHHLDLERTGLELRRVLKSGGMAVFCEPWGGNPLLNLARKCLTYPGKERTPNETPLTSRDVAILRSIFPNLEIAGQQLFSMLGRMVSRTRSFQTLTRLDEHILTRLPFCRRWCRYAVVTLRK